MGPVRIYHSLHKIATQPVKLWIALGSKQKWLPLYFRYNEAMRTAAFTKLLDTVASTDELITEKRGTDDI